MLELTHQSVQRLGVPRDRPDAPHAQDAGREEASVHGTTERILIVEDDYLIAAEVEAALTEAGFAVVGVAGNADEALALAAAQGPALAVVDIRLAGKHDGIDLALALFARHRIRSIFASAHNNIEARTRAAPAAPLAWLAKPYAMAALVRAVQQAVRELRKG
jgi:two-component system, response regulator PdtaR